MLLLVKHYFILSSCFIAFRIKKGRYFFQLISKIYLGKLYDMPARFETTVLVLRDRWTSVTFHIAPIAKGIYCIV